MAIVSIVLAAATATGLALSVEPKSKVLADQAGAMQTDEAITEPAAPSEFTIGTSGTPGDGVVDSPADETSDDNDAAEESFELPSTDSTPETFNDTTAVDEFSKGNEFAEDPSKIPISAPGTPDSHVESANTDDNELSKEPAETSTVTPESINIDIFDNEGVDTEKVYEAESSDEIIFDSGYEQKEPQVEVEEENTLEIMSANKVPVNSEDVAIELVEFKGPVTDFIVMTDLYRSALPAANRCPNSNEGFLKMVLQTDLYPWETSWSIVKRNGTSIASGPPKGRNYARATMYMGIMCLKAGRYTLKLYDRTGDGFCCKYGRGSMNLEVNGKAVEVNGETIAQSVSSEFSEVQFPIRIRPFASVTSSPMTRATPQPTNKPMRRPSNHPTGRPSNPLTRGPAPPRSLRVDVTFETDRFGNLVSETSYKFTRISDNVDVIVKNDLEKSATSVETVFVEEGDYVLTVVDQYGGLEKPGYYSVTVDGEEVMHGSRFSGGSASHIIRVGFEPKMTDREREWLNAHNSRRRDFYSEENLPFRGLVWSRELAEGSSNWADQITPTCEITRETGLVVGDNISARLGPCTGTSCVIPCTGASCVAANEGPEAILTRWVDIKRDKDWPGLAATQVWWRGTRYVGCSEKSVQSKNNPSTKCYVAICRYARAGNCGIKRSDWKTTTLADRSGCGPICPGGECY